MRSSFSLALAGPRPGAWESASLPSQREEFSRSEQRRRWRSFHRATVCKPAAPPSPSPHTYSEISREFGIFVSILTFPRKLPHSCSPRLWVSDRILRWKGAEVPGAGLEEPPPREKRKRQRHAKNEATVVLLKYAVLGGRGISLGRGCSRARTRAYSWIDKAQAHWRAEWVTCVKMKVRECRPTWLNCVVQIVDHRYFVLHNSQPWNIVP